MAIKAGHLCLNDLTLKCTDICRKKKHVSVAFSLGGYTEYAITRFSAIYTSWYLRSKP